MIYSNSIADRVLSSLIQDTSLCLNSKYPIEKEDFEPVQFHKILFATIYNLAVKGVKIVTIIDIEEFLNQYETQHNIYLDNSGSDYISTILEITDKDNYEYYYDELRKYSCLREYKKQGFDINEIYDETKEDNSQLNEWKIEDIVGYFDKIQCKIKREYIITEVKEMICGDEFDSLLDEFEKDPLLGAQFSNPIVNNLFRGWCKSHLILTGAPSSFGKTLMGSMDLINVGSLKIYDKKAQTFIDNPYYTGKSCILHSEQRSREEIQTRICSILAKVPYHTVLDGKYNKEEKERLSKAGKILKESEFKIVNYPNFSPTGIREVCRDLSLQGYEYFYQDYTWLNSCIISDLKRTMGLTNVSDTNALLHFVNALKLIAEELDIGIETAMQLNDNYKTAEIIDESCLYASRSVKTKLDNGKITTTPRKKDLEQISSLIDLWNKKFNPIAFGKESRIVPNVLNSCFKTRYGRFGENVRVWSYMDKSMGDVIDMFATTYDNIPLDIPPLYIERK